MGSNSRAKEKSCKKSKGYRLIGLIRFFSISPSPLYIYTYLTKQPQNRLKSNIEIESISDSAMDVNSTGL
jgi:hypothetical protein